MAVGRVEQVITLQGVDKASDTVAKVKGNIHELNKSSGEGFKEAAERSGDLEKGILGVRDLLGDLPAPVQKMADVFGGAEKILQIMPGPLGAVTAGIVAAGAAGYILYKNMAETEAKFKLLGDARSFAFKEQLELSVDEAVKLSQAIADLPEDVKVTDRELATVVKRAKSLGLEGGAAALSYAKALKEGPKALVEFERQFGKLGEAASKLPEISQQLGIDEKALNVAKESVDLQQQAIAARDAAQTAQIRLNALDAEMVTAQKEFSRLSVSSKESKIGEIRARRDELDVAKQAVELAKADYQKKSDALALSQRKAAADKATAELTRIAQIEIANEESKIGLAADRTARNRQQNVVTGLKMEEIERQIVVLQGQLNNGLITEQQYREGLIQLDTQRNQITAADQARQKAERAEAKAAADKRKQQLQAEAADLAKLAALQAEYAAQQGATDQEVFKKRIEAIAVQEAADIKAAKTGEGTAKDKAAKVEAIQLEAAMKAQKLRDEEMDKAVKQEEDRLKLEEDMAKSREDLLMNQLKLQAQIADNPAEKQQANLAIAQQERVKALAELEKQGTIDSEERAARKTLIEQEYTAKSVGFAKDRESAEKELTAKAEENFKKQGNAIQSIIAPAAQAVAAYTGGKGLGGAIAATVEQGKLLVENWKMQGNNSSAVIGAVGNVATAFVDGEREKAGILAIMEAAQAAVAIATGDVPGAIAHGTAAALYGSVAGGLISGGGASAASSTGGGGFAATGGAGAGGGTATGPATTVINFNAPLGTSYEIGKSVVKAQKAAGISGWSPNMAMGV